MDHHTVTRRDVIISTGVAAGTVLLAGCGGTSNGGSPASATNDSAGPTDVSGAAASQPLAAVVDVPVGGAIPAQDAGGQPIVVAQPSAGKVVAFSAICTHRGCTVKPTGDRYRCPCHGSVYDAATGRVISGPAPRPLPSVAVHVEAGEILLGAG